MKAKVIQRFKDYKHNVVREAGEVFICSKERFAEIDEKLPNYIVEVKQK